MGVGVVTRPDTGARQGGPVQTSDSVSLSAEMPRHRADVTAALRAASSSRGGPGDGYIAQDPSEGISKTDRNEAAHRAMLKACKDPRWLDEHGPAYAVLKSTEDFFTPPFREVYALPSPQYVASNYRPGPDSPELYYVNGMFTTPRDMEHHLSKLVKTYGRPVTAIINDQEEVIPGSKQPGHIRSVLHAMCGFVSSDAGYAAEPAAVERLEQVIMRHVTSGQKVQFMAHSQGSIILRNALDRVLGESSKLNETEKARVRELVSVVTFGAAEHYFPSGIRAQEYVHRNDWVALGTTVASDIREGIKNCCAWIRRSVSALFTRGDRENRVPQAVELARAPRVYLEGEHSFGPYLSKVPHFFIEKHSHEGSSSGEAVARALTRSIEQGQLSDVVHALILEEMKQKGDKEFAREFLKMNENGIIGSFCAPFQEELRALANKR